MKISPLQKAIYQESYEWMMSYAPMLVDAIEKELKTGNKSKAIHIKATHELGPDRQALALRCYQVAMYLETSENE